MYTNGKMLVAKKDERRQSSMVEEIPAEAVQPLSKKQVQKPELLDDIERPSPNVPPIYDQTLHRMAVVLAAILLVCLVLAAIVWWRLLA